MSLRLPVTLYSAFSLIISGGVHMVIAHQLMFVLELRFGTEPTLHRVEKYWGNWSRFQGPGDCVKSGFFVVSVCVCLGGGSLYFFLAKTGFLEAQGHRFRGISPLLSGGQSKRVMPLWSGSLNPRL